jgi:hypothetical protein
MGRGFVVLDISLQYLHGCSVVFLDRRSALPAKKNHGFRFLFQCNQRTPTPVPTDSSAGISEPSSPYYA